METIEALLKQAEEQHKVIQLNTMFTKNMEYFKHALPDIYKRFENYTPTEIALIITDEGWLDLVNLNLNNQPVYGCDPETFAEQTVASYLRNPLSQKLNPVITEVLNENESHTQNLNAITAIVQARNTDLSIAPITERTELMFMLGVGLGYQITEILKHTEIQHLIIAETNVDIFFASLYTFDWRALDETFSTGKKTINLILGQTPDAFTRILTQHIFQIGIYNLAKPYIFTHLSSNELTSATTSFLQNVPSIASSLGYFDDEKVGLTHTINNFKNKVPFLKSHGFLMKQFEDKPVFLMGNGPSLDKAKDFIAKYRDKVILISCGTALSSLYKLGIKPDFHVELERTYPIKEWIEVTTPPEFRKGITLLAVNTVHPDLPKLFNTVGMGLKYNDLGSSYIAQFISDKDMSVTLGACNPTVANCGLSFCAALGFTNIYLFGIDLGYPEGEKHHSSHSFHYDIKDEDIDSFNLDKPAEHAGFRLPGNFGGSVISTQLFLRSKLALEAILKDCTKMKSFNTSNGVAIEMATPIKLEDIPTDSWKTFDKKTYVKKLYNKYFGTRNFLPMPDLEDIAKSFLPTINTFHEAYQIFESDITSIDEGLLQLEKNEIVLRQFMANPSTKPLTNLLKGSSDSFSLLLAISLSANDPGNAIAMYNDAKEYYKKYLISAQHVIENNLLENDHYAFNIEQKLKK